MNECTLELVNATEFGDEEDGNTRVSLWEEEGVDAESVSPTLAAAVYLMETMTL